MIDKMCIRDRYTIGLTAYRIGINYTNNLNFINVIEPEMRAFAKEVGKTVFFGVRSDYEVVYICKTEPENPIITTATVGTKTVSYTHLDVYKRQCLQRPIPESGLIHGWSAEWLLWK